MFPERAASASPSANMVQTLWYLFFVAGPALLGSTASAEQDGAVLQAAVRYVPRRAPDDRLYANLIGFFVPEIKHLRLGGNGLEGNQPGCVNDNRSQ